MTVLELTVDVETIPAQNQAFIDAIANIKPPKTITKVETIEKWNREQKAKAIDDAYRKTALDSTKGELIVIGWAINDEEPQSVYRNLGESEADLLKAFYSVLSSRLLGGYYGHILWIGHNILNFDLPFLWHRSMINKVTPTVKIPYDAKHWSESIFDTRLVWKAASNASASLHDICTAIGIPNKQIMKGSEVWDYVKTGQVDRVAEYCREDDIRATRKLYHALKPIGVTSE